MESKRSKIFNSQKGFTLVELMTVLIILGVILGIGVPKYLRIQAQAEYDSDVKTITNIAKAAETYAAQKNISGDIDLSTHLITNKIIDGTIVLNRKASGTTSGKNTAKTALSSYPNTKKFVIDAESGQVTSASLAAKIIELIGNPLY